MFSRTKHFSVVVVAAALLVGSLAANAAPIRFDFVWVGDGNASGAIGYIIFEDTLLPNPGDTFFSLPDPAVLDLSITVTGAAVGNGTFGLADFNGVVFDTEGAMLDFSRELIGQPTTDLPWGTIPLGKSGNAPAGDTGGGGDFNLFSGGQARADYSTNQNAAPTGVSPPNGVFFFTLGADGGSGDTMVLASMRGPSVIYTVPTLNVFGLVLLGLFFMLAVGAANWRRNRLSMKG